MTTSSEPFVAPPDGLTTSLPGLVEMGAVLQELTSAQERYDHGFQKGYMAGYAEGARQAQAEKAGELAAHKAVWAAAQARVSALVRQLASATDEYMARCGARDVALTEQLMAAAFELAEAVVACELRTRPDRPLQVAKAVLASLPTGPVGVRVHPDDEAFMRDALALGSTAAAVTIVTDPAVGPGGCAVMCAGTTVDARVAEALRRARAAFCEPPAEDGEVAL
ncbi:MAG: FliH/SctL family protein [Acidimicrobiales bacterium]|jgi:flagellar assembly protein FliH